MIDNNSTYGFYLDDNWSHVYSIAHNYNKETLVGIDNNWANGSWDHDSELTSCNRFEGLGDGGWGDSWGEVKFWTKFPEGPRKDAIYAPKVTFQKVLRFTSRFIGGRFLQKMFGKLSKWKRFQEIRRTN